MSSSELGTTEAIAVIGMRGRFPGAPTLDKFWQNLRDGVESIVTFTDDELRKAGIEESWTSVPGFVRRGTFLDDIEMFDAQFFGYSPRDAQVIDPQQRLFLEVCWEALEEAGHDPDNFKGLVGVYAGSEQSSYMYQIYGHGGRYMDSAMTTIGNDKDYLTTQVSYKLNLRGPSLAVQTACSTSLVSVCLACQSLLSYQCDMALAGGVSILVPQKKGYFYQPGGIMSPDGHCRTFDASGQGTVVGSGVGVVVLRRLSEALADGDEIHAIIRGVALNNDGSMKVGFGAPSVEGQAQVVAMAQAMAGVDADAFGYVEAHGTATPLGDPIEMAALNQVFQTKTRAQGYCALGSVKSNVGHLASAAGVAGLIKTILCLKKEEIPPTLHFRTPNRQINFATSPFFVNTKLRPWPREGRTRYAAVSSFGVGGTNAHVIVEEAPWREVVPASRPVQLLMVSAKTQTALDTATDNLAAHLEQNPELDLADVAFTQQIGRKAFAHRRVLVCTGDTASAAAGLRTRDPRRVLNGFSETRTRPIVFAFSGQGAQYVDMALGLYGAEPVFRQYVDICCELLRPHLQLDLRAILYPMPNEKADATAQLTRTALAQPALFTIEYALAELWKSWGITPSAMIGHSIGEYVAACLSGVLSLADALALVAYRGQLMDQMPSGSMLAVPLGEAAVKPLLTEYLSLAAVNGPAMCVLSGPEDDVTALQAVLRAQGVESKRLHTSHAFHSSMMDPIVWPFMQYVQSATLNAPMVPYISNVTGTWITAESTTDPSYWAKHLRGTVRFADSMKELASAAELIFLEVGPGQTLSSLYRQYPNRAKDQIVLSSVRSPNEDASDVEFALRTLGNLWLSGVKVDWPGFYAAERRRRVTLPTYPFERRRFWVEPLASETSQTDAIASTQDVTNWFYVPAWKAANASVSASNGQRTPAGARWMVLTDGKQLSSRLVDRLTEAGVHVTTVVAGTSFARLDERSYSVRGGERTDYETLFHALRESREIPETIVHLWTTSPGVARFSSSQHEFDELQNLGFKSVVCLAQALQKHAGTAKVQLCVLTQGVYNVLGDDTLVPSNGTLIGPCRVIPQEYPNIRCRMIDVSEDVLQEAGTIERLLNELHSEPLEPVIAYRKGRRWIQSYDKATLEEPSNTPLREKGVYMITGGLGKIGLALAQMLATKVKARLALTSRSAFPPEDQWEHWLSEHGAQNDVSRRIRKLQELQAAGAEVLVLKADASDRDAMGKAVASIYEKFGALHGVIHGSGNTNADGFASLPQIDDGLINRQFSPKVKGMMILEELIRDKQLDFCVLLSSLSAVLGGLGLLSYAGANAYLDVFAAKKNSEHEVPWISINWDSWLFPEDKINGAAPAGMQDAITPEAGARSFLRILARAPQQVVVSTTALQDRLNKWVRLEDLRAKTETPSETRSATHSRPSLSTQFVAPRSEAEQTIAEIWQEILGITPVGIYDKFFELGGHSLLAIQLISKLREAFDIEIPAQRLFEAPTVVQLAELVDADVKAAREQDEAAEQKRLEELLNMVEGMSEEEVAALLAQPDKLAKSGAANG